MKKLYMHTVIGSFGRDCVLIIFFNFMALRQSFLKIIYFGWVSVTPPPPSPPQPFILEEELIQY